MTRRVSWLMATSFLAVLFAAAVPAARVQACSCMEMSPDEALDNAHAAFVGVVAAVDEQTETVKGVGDPFGSGSITYTVVVEEMMKGQAAKGDAIRVSSDLSTCAQVFAIGQRWRMFAHDDGVRLSTGICSGNELLAESVPVPGAASPPGAPPPVGLLVGIGAVALLAAVSAWAFTRSGRTDTAA